MSKALPQTHCLHDAPICCDTCSSVLHHRDVACATTSYSQHSITCETLARLVWMSSVGVMHAEGAPLATLQLSV